MDERNSLVMEIVRVAPGTILQINAGDLSEFAGDLVSGVIEALNNTNAKRKVAELLTIDEVARIMKVSKMTLHRWDKNGFLKKVNIGSQRRYRRADVEAITERRKEA